MSKTVTVLGFNGRIGQAVTRAFVAAGWQVTGLGRGNRAQIAGMTHIEGSADSPEDVRRAAADADVVVNALNLPYHTWEGGNAERQLQAVLEGLKGSGKTMLFPGNIYNYGASQHLLTPDTPQRPEKEKGRIRKRMEDMLARAATGGDVQVIIIRSADFYGPGATETAFDLAMLRDIEKGVLRYPGNPAIGHGWAYLPDLGRAYVKVAEVRETLPRFESFHFEGHFATGHQMIETVQSALPQRAEVRSVPWWLMRVIGLFSPLVRAVMEMNYLWDEPHRLRDDAFAELLGPDFGTPFAVAVTETVRSFLPEEKAAAQRALAG